MGQKEKKGAARGGEIKRKKEGTLTRESRQQQPQQNCQRDNTTHHRDAVRCVFIFFLKKKTHFSLSTFSSSTLFWGLQILCARRHGDVVVTVLFCFPLFI
jgi:hypothetical protein